MRPPAVLLHRHSGSDESFGHQLKIFFRIVETEDESTATHPTQRQPLGTEVELEHPIIAAGDVIQDGPNRREVGHSHGQARRGEAFVETLSALIPTLIQTGIPSAHFGRFQALQENLHRGHHIRVRVERAAGKANVGRSILAVAPHQGATTADDTDRESAAQGFTVSDHVGIDPEVFLGPARSESEPQEDLIKYQNNAALGAYLAQGLEPFGVALAIEASFAGAIHQCRVTGSWTVRMQRLKGVDQHASDILACGKHPKRVRIHFLQRVRATGRHGVSRTRLNIVPPSMIGAAEPNQMLASGMVARQAHRLHDGFGARHVERHLVLARNAAKAFRIPGGAGMQATQNRTQSLNPPHRLLHARLVEVVAHHINPIGAGQIQVAPPIQIRDLHPLRRLDKSSQFQMSPHVRAELERHPIGSGELKVGDVTRRLRRLEDRSRMMTGKLPRQTEKPLSTGCFHRFGSSVGAEHLFIPVGIPRNPAGDPLGPSGVPRQRRMFGKGELQTPPTPCQRTGCRDQGKPRRIQEFRHEKKQD